MTRVPTVRQADVARVLKALKAEGLGVASVVIRPHGEVVITPGDPAAALPEPAPADKPSDLDSWRARRDERRAT